MVVTAGEMFLANVGFGSLPQTQGASTAINTQLDLRTLGLSAGAQFWNYGGSLVRTKLGSVPPDWF